MALRGTGAGLLALIAVVGSLAGCSRGTSSAPQAAQSATSRAGYCVGVDASHKADGSVTVTFERGSQVLGEVTGAVTGAVSVGAPPGDVTVKVDGTEVARMIAPSGGSVYANSGSGCPSALTP